MIKVFDRNKNKEVFINEEASLRFLYKTFIGRLLLKIIVIPFFSKVNSYIIKSGLSKIYIKKFIKKNNIDMNDYENIEYKSFNDFFIRKILPNKRIIDDNSLFAVCDSKLSVYQINDDLNLFIKNSYYSLKELINENIDDSYKNGICLVFRLTKDDYHHYVFPDKGSVISSKLIGGVLHTVNPIAFDKYKVFITNQRNVSKLNTISFDDIYYIEIGALNIGKIHNRNVEHFEIGEEKGYFSFGASTIVLLIKNGKVVIDEDIVKYTSKGYEVKVKLGEKIGIIC